MPNRFGIAYAEQCLNTGDPQLFFFFFCPFFFFLIFSVSSVTIYIRTDRRFFSQTIIFSRQKKKKRVGICQLGYIVNIKLCTRGIGFAIIFVCVCVCVPSVNGFPTGNLVPVRNSFVGFPDLIGRFILFSS